MPERRRYRRSIACLPLRLNSVAGKIEPAPVVVPTQNISKAGVCFPAPRRIEPGQLIEVEVAFPGALRSGRDIHISAEGYIVRIEPGNKPGWYKLAAAFDEPPSDEERRWHELVAEFEQSLRRETD